MTRKTRFAALAWIAAASCPLFAQDAPRRLSLTVYNDNLALVRDARRLPVKEGTGELRFADVASQIDPTSVHLRSPDGKVSILEQDYEYDLVNADKLLSKYVDQPVQLFTKDGRMFEGTLLAPGGDIVLEKKDGSIEAVSRANLQNVDFPKLPAGLVTRPTLVWTLQSEKGGDRDLELSYLTGGISWHAEYVGVLDPSDKKLDLSAWVSIDNQSGATYDDAALKLIAGNVHRAQPEIQPFARGKVMAAMSAAAEGAFEEKAFFEYHLYTLQRPATLKDNQTKQLALFPAASVPVRKIYNYDASRDPKKVRVTVEFSDSKSDGLGLPLPAGKVRIYKEDEDKSQEFVGEDRLEHTPKDEKVRLAVGDAFDIVPERKVLESKSLGSRARQDTVQITLRNHKDEDAEVVVDEKLWGDWEIDKSSFKAEKKDAGTAEFKVPVKKDGEAVLEYTCTSRW